MVIGMKYSIIVCVYNGKKYIDKCLSSLLSQTYSHYEIILIDDGSTDSSLSLLKKYEKNPKVTLFSHKNKGLSESRNIGVNMCTGDYLLFVDIDDTVPSTFLETIDKNMEENLDLIKFNYAYLYDHKEMKKNSSHFEGKVVSGQEAFTLLTYEKVPFELAVLYAYRREFYLQNHFTFAKGMYHEDYGLIPFVILKSKRVKLLDDVLYYYYQSSYSITRNDDYAKTVKKANDIFTHSVRNKKKVSKLSLAEESKRLYYSYMANAILLKYDSLQGKEKKMYKNKIKEAGILCDLLDDTIQRKIKKIMWKIKIR